MRVLVSALFLSLFAPAAPAALITYGYTGTATYTEGIFAGQGTNAVTGTFSFDDGLLDWRFVDPGIDDFLNSTPATNQSLTSSFGATFKFGSLSFSDTASDPSVVDSELRLIDGLGADEVLFAMYHREASDPFFRLSAIDFGGISEPDGVLQGSNGLTGTASGAIARLDTLDLSLFNAIGSLSTWHQYDAGHYVGRVDFTWTGIQRVPEPASPFLLTTGLLGIAIGCRKRIRKLT